MATGGHRSSYLCLARGIELVCLRGRLVESWKQNARKTTQAQLQSESNNPNPSCRCIFL